MKRTILVLAFLGLLLAGCAAPAASPAATGSIEVKEAWARPALAMDMSGDSSGNASEGGMGGSNGAAYLTIINTGAAADRLTGVESDVAASAELHQTVMQEDVMSMSPVEAVEVPANGQVEFKPGGYHVMLVGLKQDLNAGDTVKLTLIFEKAGRIDVNAEVKNP